MCASPNWFLIGWKDGGRSLNQSRCVVIQKQWLFGIQVKTAQSSQVKKKRHSSADRFNLPNSQPSVKTDPGPLKTITNRWTVPLVLYAIVSYYSKLTNEIRSCSEVVAHWYLCRHLQVQLSPMSLFSSQRGCHATKRNFASCSWENNYWIIFRSSPFMVNDQLKETFF